MQRKEFENRIKNLLPKAADDVVESWAAYATELDHYGTEVTADFYDKNYMQGWINSSLLDITVKDGKMSGKNQSTVIYKYMNQLIEAVGKDV